MSSEAKSLGVQNHTGTDSIFPWAPEGCHNAGKLKDAKGKEVKLFTPLKIRDLVLKNRIFVSPMCQYSSPDGFMTDWHFVHYGAFAVGGAGLVCIEATAVAPEGRISPYDSGLWKDEHIPNLARIVKFLHEHQAAAAIQIGHAGRKASTNAPWMGKGDYAVLPADHPLAWQAVGPSAIPFSETYLLPKELTKEQIHQIQKNFVDTAIRADKAGFDVLELHGAHGYLMSSFCSPNSNTRTDEYGGSFENRTRFILETVRAVRKVWPAHKPLFIRLSCTEWVETGGWDIDQTVKLAEILKNEGIDVIDCSSGGINSAQKIAVKPSFQVPFAEAVRKTGLLTAAVGLITEPKQAEEILQSNQADLVALARVLLRNPRWAYSAAVELGVEIEWAPQYERAKPRI